MKKKIETLKQGFTIRATLQNFRDRKTYPLYDT